jgi:cell pole-organizing protein PopZ
MNKPESTGAKSLEEILASIRKSLAEEAADPRASTLKPAQPQLRPLAPEPGPTAPSTTAPGKGAGMLSAKLAGSANGAARGPLPDPDLSELLAGEPKKPASPAPAEPSKPAGKSAAEEDAKDKDPLWFLSRLSAAAAGSPGPSSAARARDAAKAATPPAEEIKLSRPETLRASFPPLFDAAAEPAPLVAKAERKANADAATTPTARTEPRVLTPVAEPAPAKEAQDAMKGLGKQEAGAPTPFSFAPAALKDGPAPPKASPEPTLAESKPMLAGLTPSAPPLETKPAADTPAEPGRWNPEPAAIAPGEALPTRPLEQMVAELLEPVIRQWLHNNLPRLIEKAVREEVARVVAAEHESRKA